MCSDVPGGDGSGVMMNAPPTPMFLVYGALLFGELAVLDDAVANFDAAAGTRLAAEVAAPFAFGLRHGFMVAE